MRGAAVWRAGYCDVTDDRDPGECDEPGTDNSGSWKLPASSFSSWEQLSATCSERCRHCRLCRFVSFSLPYRDCSWFRSCDVRGLRTSVSGFRTLRVPRNASQMSSGSQVLSGGSSSSSKPPRDEFHSSRERPLLAAGYCSAPREEARRSYVRRTLQAISARDSRLRYRFVIGTAAAPPAELLQLEAERSRHSDLALLAQLRDGNQHHNTEKVLRWLSLAFSHLFPTARFFAKIDTDTYLVWARAAAHLSALAAAHPRRALAVGAHQWSHFANDNLERPQMCDCCGFSEQHARQVARDRATAAFGKCEPQLERPAGRVSGPLPFPIGTFYALSRSAVAALLTARSDWLGKLGAAGALPHNFAAIDDVAMGLMLSKVPRAASVELGGYKSGALLHNVDEHDGERTLARLLGGACLRALNVSTLAGLRTGGLSPWKEPEVVSPAGVAVHHVKSEAQWLRVEAKAAHWARAVEAAATRLAPHAGLECWSPRPVIVHRNPAQ